MKIISWDDADHLLNWTKTADALQAGHSLPKASVGDLLLQESDDSLLSRGAWISGLGMALKSVSIFPANVSKSPPLPSIQGGVLLFDATNGSLKAVLDGVLVTKWKTAGDSVLGARLLARPNPKSHLMIGAGTVAHTIIDAYAEIFPSITDFTIWNRSRDKAEKLARTYTERGLRVSVADDLATATSVADIITSATMVTDPILKGEWVKPGTHVDLIGAYRPDMREADDDLMKKSEIFVDSRETTIGHIGEIEIPLQAGIITLDDIKGDFYDLCSGKSARSDDDAITIFKNGGGAHLDLMTSSMIFDSVTGS